MATRLISSDDLQALVASMGLDALVTELISDLRQACVTFDPADTEVRARDGFRYVQPRPGLIEWMPVLARGKSATIKMVAYHPTNPNAFGLPTIIGSIGRYDARTGRLVGLCDGTLPTALRTAAASALATSILAPRNAGVLAFVGTGAQAVAHLHALLKVTRPERVLAHDVSPINEATFAQRTALLRPAGLEVERASLDQVLEEADVITTATSIAVGEGPVFPDSGSTRPGLHVNAVGSDLPGKTELPVELLRRAVVVPDHLQQCLDEGECQQLDPAEVGPTLAGLVRNESGYRALRTQTTVFDSTGWVVEDQVVMSLIMRHAERLGLGRLVDLHHLPTDPMNPFESLSLAPRPTGVTP